MWEEGLKLDDPEILARRIEAAGLDARALLERAQRPEMKQRLADDTEARGERGAFGIPTFFVGDGNVLRQGAARPGRGGSHEGGR